MQNVAKVYLKSEVCFMCTHTNVVDMEWPLVLANENYVCLLFHPVVILKQGEYRRFLSI